MGWSPDSLKDPDLMPFISKWDELSLQGNCVISGTRVIVPEKLKMHILKELHSSYAKIPRMKECMWWPNLDNHLENLTSSCSEGLEKRAMPPTADAPLGLAWSSITPDSY